MLDSVETPDDFEVILGSGTVLDPLERPAEATEAIAEAAQAGATICTPSLVSRSLSHYLEQLDALAT